MMDVLRYLDLFQAHQQYWQYFRFRGRHIFHLWFYMSVITMQWVLYLYIKRIKIKSIRQFLEHLLSIFSNYLNGTKRIAWWSKWNEKGQVMNECYSHCRCIHCKTDSKRIRYRWFNYLLTVKVRLLTTMPFAVDGLGMNRKCVVRLQHINTFIIESAYELN